MSNFAQTLETKVKAQSEALALLQDMNPDQVQEIDGVLTRVIELDYDPWYEFGNSDLDDQEESVDTDFKFEVEGSPFFVKANLSYLEIEDGAKLSFVFMQLHREIQGLVQNLEVPAVHSGRMSKPTDGSTPVPVPVKFVGRVIVAGTDSAEFSGDKCPETGLPTLIRYTRSGIYINRNARRWIESMREELNTSDLQGVEFARLATIVRILGQSQRVIA